MATTASLALLPTVHRSNSDDVSPKASVPRGSKDEYFPADITTVDGSGTSVRASEGDESSARKSSISYAADPATAHSSSIGSTDDDASTKVNEVMARKASISSVTFRRPRNPSLPQGNPQHTTGSRIRASSPPHQRFQRHIAFDNVPAGEPTKNNAISLTLNVRHKGYQPRRRSRTFMVGVDEHAYSDYALQWLLEELVDDGDEIVCVRVIEKEIRFSDKQYQEDAQSVMHGILERNGSNRAVSIVLEYAVGKLHATFQKLIQMYQPAMLIVGTRGRSLGGLQGLVNTRNSFSKYCLQYSPVPVVVVRPTEKRMKKKTKRANDSTRQTYISMLAATHGKHEADSEASSTYELEIHNSPDEEAHQVARVLGLPAAFDPTIKPISPGLRPFIRSPGPASINEAPEEQPVLKNNIAVPESDDDDDDDSAEFDVMTGQQALDKQKLEQLHKMEVGEAAAFKMKVEDEEDDEDEGSLEHKATS